MALKTEAYKAVLTALFPPGKAWNVTVQTLLGKLAHGFAPELARIDARTEILMNEVDPRTSVEMLADWERVCGLPDPCTTAINQPVPIRRSDVIAKLSSTGGQSKSYLMAICAAQGFLITILEFYEAKAGRLRCGGRLTNGPWKFTFRIAADEAAITEFVVDGSTVGEPLRYWDNDRLVCIVNKHKPAHTYAQFTYVASNFRAGQNRCGDRLKQVSV